MRSTREDLDRAHRLAADADSPAAEREWMERSLSLEQAEWALRKGVQGRVQMVFYGGAPSLVLDAESGSSHQEMSFSFKTADHVYTVIIRQES